jgi:hypothetical protein
MDAAQSQWMGLVELPQWSAGDQAGLVFVQAEFPVNSESPDESLNHEGYAGFSESSLNNQFILPDKSAFLSITWADQMTSSGGGSISFYARADHPTINDYSTASPDGHPIKAQQDSWLVAGHGSVIVQTSSWHGLESDQGERWAFIDGSPIFVLDVQTSGDAAIPGRNWSGANDNIFELQEVPLLLFHALPGALSDANGFVGVPVVVPASELNESEHQNNQNALRHSLSFGSLTLPPDRSLVNRSVENCQ